ncbi:cleavage stimulation factor subunit 2 [Cryptococcus neoformans Tu401-1]|uniref:Cleavage stimulation factor subunit 2 n=1 Tax=Cryptococcus neoformans Tu259-1 TaxID=1230072 RepID=A0A854QD35_CRYNE|nr:cleavage stimulation factor subunit 2 [Cryptococcus neoformans var. grubii Tu401-1]OXG13912.1 cleavage stimulation factor subunit 2 [Cryptococcus neoformans var. grubii Tu259-1]OXM77091.1 cleavage stimulation factor subunit 2 [Cryptococcus neoformans var. grubii Bt63]
MASMKTLITTNPDQARQLLSSKPQLAYALFQAMLLMSIIDPSVLQRIQPIPANAAALPAPYPPAANPFPYGVPPPQSQPPPSSYPSYPPAGAPGAPSPVAGGPGYRGAPPPSVAGGYNAGAPLLYNNLATARHNLDLLLGMVRLLQLQHHLLREWLGYRPLPRLLWQPFQRISRRCFFKCCSSLRTRSTPWTPPKKHLSCSSVSSSLERPCNIPLYYRNEEETTFTSHRTLLAIGDEHVRVYSSSSRCSIMWRANAQKLEALNYVKCERTYR